MPNYRAGILVFIQERCSARQRDLIDVLLDLLGRHPNTFIADGKRFRLSIQPNLNRFITRLARKIARFRQRPQLLGRIYRIGHKLP